MRSCLSSVDMEAKGEGGRKEEEAVQGELEITGIALAEGKASDSNRQ